MSAERRSKLEVLVAKLVEEERQVTTRRADKSGLRCEEACDWLALSAFVCADAEWSVHAFSFFVVFFSFFLANQQSFAIPIRHAEVSPRA